MRISWNVILRLVPLDCGDGSVVIQPCCQRRGSRSHPMRRADRLFQIIQILRRSSRPVTAAALAEELEISKRTVYRDIADLMGQRVPIEGEAGLGYLLASDYDMPPLMLTPDEIEAVMLGAQWVAGRSDKALANAARDVIAKIAAVVPEHLRPFIVEPSVGVKPTLTEGKEGIDPSTMR